ncbi:type II toxin-antitoxin system VapC family toxin [Pararcticibacter amylolyticus]|nr:PIN domain-containing protein [Pararcticibacter amylolyticus]
MALKAFLDANILLDFLLKRENYSVSRKVVALAVEGRIVAYVTPAIIHIVGYWLTKAYGSKKTKELLLTLLTDIRVIDISHDMTIMALNSKIDDIEDALQYYSALANKLDYFISSDKKFQKLAIPSLPVVPPEYFINSVINTSPN